MASEADSGRPPSPARLPAGMQLAGEHPAGALMHPAVPRPADATRSAALPTDSPAAEQLERQVLKGSSDDMPVDAEEHQQQPLSRSQSPAQSSGLAMAAALKPQCPEQQPASGFVPLSELGGGSGRSTAAVSLQQEPPSIGSGSSEEEPSSSPVERPVSAMGYESGDDMDVLTMPHCTNCTGKLVTHMCMDCGHMLSHNDEIFHPTVASTAALHRPRLQGDALTVICWDERMELHEEVGGSGLHPERPDRVRAVMARLVAAELEGRCRRLPAREATAAEIEACHIPELLEAIDLLSEQSRLHGNAGMHFSSDTYVNQHTAMCAKLSAGACVDVSAAVMRGEARAGVAVVRPPGHHAESNTAMGFCFFNNAGIAARAAQVAGAERVLVLDWDVHHGNGTQHIFEADPSVLYMSLHRYDGGSFYPGTGAAHEVGEGRGEGYSVNVPWPCGGMRNGDYLAAFQHVVLPIAYEYAPDLIIISAGFDAADGDPIGGCHLTPECYAHMAAQLQLVAPTVALLEGGYNLLSTAKGTEAVVRVLLGERPPPLPASEQAPCEYAMSAVAQVMRIQARYWECMRGLVQQQFRVLAAAKKRQEQLAAMAQRRAEAAAAAVATRPVLGLGTSLYGDQDDGGGLFGDHADGEVTDDLEDALMGDDLPHMPRQHRPPYSSMDGLDEAEADTPHQEFRGGSGWESDADLASSSSEDEGEELTQGGSDNEEQQDAAAEQQEHAGAGLSGGVLHSGDGSVGGNSGAYASDASPLHMAPAERLPSDTAPLSDSEAPGSGTASHGSLQRSAGSAGLTSASLSPAAITPNGAATLAPEQSLDASACPLPEEVAAPPPPPPKPVLQLAPAAGREASPDADAGCWRSLAVKQVVLKRPGHPPHQRLSPALVDEDAMQLLHPSEQQAQPTISAERAVPQHEQ